MHQPPLTFTHSAFVGRPIRSVHPFGVPGLRPRQLVNCLKDTSPVEVTGGISSIQHHLGTMRGNHRSLAAVALKEKAGRFPDVKLLDHSDSEATDRRNYKSSKGINISEPRGTSD